MGVGFCEVVEMDGFGRGEEKRRDGVGDLNGQMDRDMGSSAL